MDLSSFIKENEFPYDTGLDDKIKKVEQLVEKKIISYKLASFLIGFFIKREVTETVKHNLDHILHSKRSKQDR